MPEKKTDNIGWIRALLFPKKTPAPTTAIAPTAPTRALGWPKIQRERVAPAFWTVASVFSMIVNVILVIVLLVLARQLFVLKRMVGDGLLGGLYQNFILMDQAKIQTNVVVETEIPVKFSLPVKTNTSVTLTENTRIDGALVTLNTGGLNITNAPANIILPAGTILPIALDISVPVDANVPVTLNVPVSIPLDQTELHTPFVGLQQVISPYYWLLQPQIKSAADIPACKFSLGLCGWFFK
ncbi:MAG: hypothetical protein OHK0031_07010 [Anaerolineales bacterium]